MAITFDSIGGNSFIRLDGDIDVNKADLRECTRPGVDGRAFRKLGKRSETVELTGITDVLDDATAGSVFAVYSALVGTTQSIVKCGVIHADYLVNNVRVLGRKKVEQSRGGTLGGGATYLVESVWTLTKAGTA